MPSQSLDGSERPSGAVRRRVIAIALALLFEGLIILMLLTFGPLLTRKKESALLTFGVDEGKGDKAEQSKKAEKKQEKKKHQDKPKPQHQPQPVPQQNEKLDDSILPPNFIKLSRSTFAATNIGAIKRSASSSAPEEADADSGESDSEAAAGHGPHGERLYNAEWYRRPTNAELDTYLPERSRGVEGSGLIACRTIANYHVDDCVEIGETPRGSGFGGAVRQAAWQFLVRPPRVGGKPLIGSWVSIRIDYTLRGGRPD